MLNPHRRAVRWCLVAAWAAFIFFMSAHTGSSLSSGFFATVRQWGEALLNGIFGYHEDPFSPVCHFLEYLVLGVLLSNAMAPGGRWGRVFLVAVVLASAYGVTDEIHQLLVPGRMCDPADWAVDTAGAALGAAVFALLARR